jgi:hypothetical protein
VKLVTGFWPAPTLLLLNACCWVPWSSSSRAGLRGTPSIDWAWLWRVVWSVWRHVWCYPSADSCPWWFREVFNRFVRPRMSEFCAFRGFSSVLWLLFVVLYLGRMKSCLQSSGDFWNFFEVLLVM